MKRILCLLALLCLFLKLPAQDNQSNKSGLAIGDIVPEITITNILNHPTGKANISDYRGKWLIIDFWATWCAPCITAFPKLDSLQEVFQGQVQFLPVAYQSKAEVEKLLTKLEKLKGFSIDLPLVVADTRLNNLFPHKYLPYYVWIDPEGAVAATTDHREVTAANIKALLAKKDPVLENKEYVRSPFNKNELLLAGNNEMTEKKVVFQSALLPYTAGLSSGYTIFPTDPEQGKRILATNSRLLSLFQLAYSGDIYFSNNRTVIEVEDRSAFVAGKTGKAYAEWLQNGHAWCYELIVPADQEDKVKQIMQEDLQRFFPQYQATVQERKISVLALVRIGKKDKKHVKPLGSRGGEYKAEFSLLGGELRNGLLVDLIARLNAYFLQKLPTPIIDETGYTGRVDLKLDANMSDVASIRKALRDYGLDLVEMDRKIRVLVIEDTNKGT